MGRTAKWVLGILLAALVAVGAVAYFRSKEVMLPVEPPDLTGRWVQVGATPESDWYFYADVSDDLIKVWWYLPSEDERALYWWGTFTPPTEGAATYSWTSINNEEMAHTSQRASREPEKNFTYKNDRISYVLTAGHLQMGYALERESASAMKGKLPPAD